MCDLAGAVQVSAAGYSGWMCSSGTPILSYCSWSGVTCAGTAVTSINLNEYGAVGSIPSEIGYLTQLYFLSLNYNILTGSIPSSIGSLSLLTYLNLDYNILSYSIPSSIGFLALLRGLSFNDNMITGTIPSSIGYLTQLSRLDLHYNLLSGTIPSSIGYLTELHALYLNGNKLTGAVPSAIGYLSHLYNLFLKYNSLTGSIPSHLCAIRTLKVLDASSNRIACYSSCLTTVSAKHFDTNTGMCTSSPSSGMLFMYTWSRPPCTCSHTVHIILCHLYFYLVCKEIAIVYIKQWNVEMVYVSLHTLTSTRASILRLSAF